MDLSYRRLASGIEVDFVGGDLAAAIEVKGTEQAGSPHVAGLQAIREDHPRVGRRILVCLERRRRVREDGIEVLPVREFLARLWADALF
jgi:hypothetical protein